MKINWNHKRSKHQFVSKLPKECRLLDIGCGNGSPAWVKSFRPDIYYIGLDVGDYNQPIDPRSVADEYIISTSDQFAASIEKLAGQVNAVVSSHNLEHCDDPERVLAAMSAALIPDGTMYLSFPCEASAKFPKRGGCLNFFDDATHKIIPKWKSTLEALERAGCAIEFKAQRYRPYPLWLKGLLMEPVSMIRKEVIRDGSTWALYGFESVIWARKISQQQAS